MKRISFQRNFQEETKENKITNKRQLVVKEFHEELLKGWDEKKYGELKVKRIAVMLAPLSYQDLYAFLSKCKSANSFSRFFWWSFKSKKNI